MMIAGCARWLVLFVMVTSPAAARPFGGAGVGPTDARSSDQRFLAGLRQRGLFELAETYCTERLQRKDLPDSKRADLVIERSRCLAEWAVSSPPGQREPLWQRAFQVVEDFAGEHPDSPRLPLVRLQQALGHLARGELARQEAQLTADSGALLGEARTHLRAAVGELRRLSDEVESRLRPRGHSREDLPSIGDQHATPGLTDDQLASLKRNIQYQLARALRNQAQCYPAESPDRANSLVQAVELLRPLAGLDVADPLAWKSRLDLIASRRMLADYQGARRKLDALLARRPPPAVALRARAERIRLALASDQIEKATSLLGQGRQIAGTTSPELDYAWLEAYLAAGRAAADAGHAEAAANWQAKATHMVETIEQLHGPYWTRRAGMLLSGYVRASSATGDLATLVRAAESLFRSGQFDDALAAYDRARTLAAQQGNADRAFDLGYVAATIEHRRRRHEAARDRYRRIALAAPDQLKAPEAHLLAIYHAGQLARAAPRGAVAQYTALLQEHVRTWPNGPTADGARRRLGQLRQHRRQWQGAIQAYRAISPGDAEYLQVVEAVERCYRAWLAQREAAGEPTEPIAEEAAEWFESVVLGPGGKLPERWSPVQRAAVLAAARLRLNHTAAGYARAQGLLSAALQGAAVPSEGHPPGRSDGQPAEWQAAARGLLVLCLAAQGRTREAGQLLAKISAGRPEELIGVLEGLGKVAAAAGPEVRSELARLQLRTIELLSGSRPALSRTEQRSLERIHAGALADAGRTEGALSAYKALAEAYPRDGAIQEAFAQLLLTREDPASLKAALAKWRQLAERSTPRSRRWFRAKYSVAWLHYRLGNKRQAAKIITLVQLLHPDCGGPEMKSRFDELLKRCGQ